MIQAVFELSVNIVECFWVAYFVCSYLGSKFERKAHSILGFLAIWIIEFVTITVTNSITFFEGMGNYLTFAIRLVYILLFLKGGLLLKAWISAITQIILVLTALTGNLFICFVLNYSPMDMITVFGWQRIVGVCFVQLVHFAVSFFILKAKTTNPIKTRIWYSLIIVPLLSALVALKLFPIVFAHPEYLNVILLALMTLVPLNVLVYYFYTVISREYDNKLRISTLELQNRNAELQIEQSRAFVEQMRAVRHDIRNHLTVVAAYVEGGRTEDAVKYIKEIDSKHLPLMKEYISMDNSALEAVINSKIALCNQRKIFSQIHISPDVRLWINDVETVTLFGNILDNAIDAVSKDPDGRISLSITQNGKYTSVLVCNTITESVLEKNPNLETTNSDREMHGIGLKNVRAIVSKYNGMMEFYEENGEFCCHILL